MTVKSDSKVAQWRPTLSYPMDCSLPGFSVHRIFQAKVLEWGAIAFSDRIVFYFDFIDENYSKMFNMYSWLRVCIVWVVCVHAKSLQSCPTL